MQDCVSATYNIQHHSDKPTHKVPSHSDLHMQYKIVSVLHTVSSTTVINTPGTKNQHTRRVFYRSPTPALSATWKGPRTPPRSHLWPLGWHKPKRTHMPDTPANRHVGSPPPNANSGRPTETKGDDPRLGYYIPTTRAHVSRLTA